MKTINNWGITVAASSLMFIAGCLPVENGPTVADIFTSPVPNTHFHAEVGWVQLSALDNLPVCFTTDGSTPRYGDTTCLSGHPYSGQIQVSCPGGNGSANTSIRIKIAFPWPDRNGAVESRSATYKVDCRDQDADSVNDTVDNCLNMSNPRQYDANRDGKDDYCLDMTLIRAGTFTMGANYSNNEDEQPEHSVSVPAFRVMKHEVTFEQYDAFAVATGRALPPDNWGRGNMPVVNISWKDAVAFADWYSQQTVTKMRLPSEAEWEYMARAGTTTQLWFTNDLYEETRRANCVWPDCNDAWEHGTAPVGSFPPNRFGLYDTAGNVAEMVLDCYRLSYVGAPTDGSALGGDGSACWEHRVRGGSWFGRIEDMRSAARSVMHENYVSNSLGFRLVQEVAN